MFMEAKYDGGGSDNWTTGAISRAKLESNHHHQQTNIQFFYRLFALPVIQPTVSKHWRDISHFMDLLTPSSPGGLPTLSLITNSSWLLGEGCHATHQPSDASTPSCTNDCLAYLNYNACSDAAYCTVAVLILYPLHFSGHFSRWTWVNQYQNVCILDFIGAKDDGGGGDNWIYKTCKAPVKLSPPTNHHSAF